MLYEQDMTRVCILGAPQRSLQRRAHLLELLHRRGSNDGGRRVVPAEAEAKGQLCEGHLGIPGNRLR